MTIIPMLGKKRPKPAPAPSPAEPPMPAASTAADPAPPPRKEAASTTAKTDRSGTTGKLLADHKGKLAVGAAAMLGAAIYYKWRESKLAKEDPQEYARLQRLKESVRQRELQASGGKQESPNDAASVPARMPARRQKTDR